MTFNFGEGSTSWHIGRNFRLTATIVDKNTVAMKVVTELPTKEPKIEELLEAKPCETFRGDGFAAHSYRWDLNKIKLQCTEQAVTVSLGKTARLETKYTTEPKEGYYNPTSVVLFITPHIAYTRQELRRFWKEKHTWEAVQSD